MSEQLFQDLSRQMFELYRQGKYSEAYDVVTHEADRFPEWSNRIQYWRICLATRMGDIDHALEIFGQEIDAGGWFWKTGLREDPDLAPLQGLPRFEQLVDVSLNRQHEARIAAVPHALVFEPDISSLDVKHPLPLFIALHGNNSSAEASASYWRPATSLGWLVVLPQSTQVGGPGSYVWNDREWTAEEIINHHASIIDQYEIDEHLKVIAGFSMGARWSIWLALTGSLPVAGFIAVAPFLPDSERFVELVKAARNRSLRGYFVVGDQDKESAESTREVAALMQSENFACEVETHLELGHAYPEDFQATLKRALDFVATDS